MIRAKAGIRWRSFTVVVIMLLATLPINGAFSTPAQAGTDLTVPGDYPTIQAAVNAAAPGDRVVISPGVYTENIIIATSDITITSTYLSGGGDDAVAQTVIDGNDGSYVLWVQPTATNTAVAGLSLRNADDGVLAEARIHFSANHVTDTHDAIDFQRGSAAAPVGGVVMDNVLEGNFDDGVDLDNAVDVAVHNNIIRDNRDGGIEVRFHEYTGPTLEVVITENTITGNGEDGIQLIGDNGVTDRLVRIERNVIAGNDLVGIGTMPDGNTKEALTGGDLKETVTIVNNTIVGNSYGITAGDNMAIVNNIIAGNSGVGLKRARVDSIATFNVFWDNGVDIEDAIVDIATTSFEDPRLSASYIPAPNGAGVDAGTPSFMFGGVDVVGITSYSGAAPDAGVHEFIWETTARFIDVPIGHTFFSSVQWLAAEGITRGCNPPLNDRYCPQDPVTRGQMAAFLVRGLGLTAGAGSNEFIDDDASVFEDDIDRLATAGITFGCNPPLNDRFCPHDPVTRGQMAAFLDRALGS